MGGDKDCVTSWFDMLTGLGVVGTIDTARLLPTLKIVDDISKKNGKSVSKMHQMILGRPLVGAHRAGTDVDGVVNILNDSRVMEKMMAGPIVIPIAAWLEHSNHSKARKDWEARMTAEIEAENDDVLAEGGATRDMGECSVGEVVSTAIVVDIGTGAGSDDGEESDESQMSREENDLN